MAFLPWMRRDLAVQLERVSGQIRWKWQLSFADGNGIELITRL